MDGLMVMNSMVESVKNLTKNNKSKFGNQANTTF